MECFDIVQKEDEHSFLVVSVARISTCMLLVAVHRATNAVGFSPLLKPPESISPPDQLLSVSTTNSPGGKICRLQKLHEK